MADPTRRPSVHRVPVLIAAERGLDEVLPRLPEFVARAKELAAALGDLDGVETDVPGVQKAELTIGAGSLEVAIDEARELYRELLSASA